MVVKLVLVMAVLALVLVAAVVAAFVYFSKREEHRHEKEMLRERRDAELLTGEER